MSSLVVIPARWASTRFPGKSLAELGGKSILAHVWERCRSAFDSEQIIIATDDERIFQASKSFGARTMMTSRSCLTGTDRVAEVAATHSAAWYINVQGDEPFIDPKAIIKVRDAALAASIDIAAVNAMSTIDNEKDFRSPSVPKVVTDQNANLLYISRAAIPTDKVLSLCNARRQIGLYAFRQSSLRLFAEQRIKTPLEAIEDIEILRLLEVGCRIQMVEVANGGPAVDTPADLERAKAYLSLLSRSAE